VCHLIQDRALEHQFFELIINLASLQPITEDRLEAENCRLRQTPTMIVALPLPLFAPDFSDPPQVLVAGVTLRLAVGLAPYPGPLARRDRCPRPMVIERVVASPLIVGAGADSFDHSGRVLKQIRQGFGLTDIVRACHNADDFQRRFIHAEVEFEPGPAFPDAVLADFPLAFAVNFDASRIHHQVAWLGPILDRQGACQLPPTS
jgi:hypothetical protein